MAELYPDLKDRPIKETIVLFDVDGTLTPARLSVSAQVLQALSKLRNKVAIGFVSISLLSELQVETLTPTGWWLRSQETTRTAGHSFPPRCHPVRLCLLGEWPHRLPPGRAATLQFLPPMDR